MLITALVAAAALQQAPPVQLQVAREARSPAWAADGRVAVAVRGDLGILHPGPDGVPARAEQLTSGPAWDRDPAWGADGSLVFASDRAGSVDLWRLLSKTSGRPALNEIK